jgi:hypothetical protein
MMCRCAMQKIRRKLNPIPHERLVSSGITDPTKEMCLQLVEYQHEQNQVYTLHKGPGARRVRRLLRRAQQAHLRELAAEVSRLSSAEPIKLTTEGMSIERVQRREHNGLGAWRAPIFIESEEVEVTGVDLGSGPNYSARVELHRLGPDDHFHIMERLMPVDMVFSLHRPDVPEKLEGYYLKRREVKFPWAFLADGPVLPPHTPFVEDCKVEGCSWPGVHAHQLGEDGKPDPARIIQEG